MTDANSVAGTSFKIIGFASRVVKHGFAACCEDVALPFRTGRSFLTWALPFWILLSFRGARHSRQEKDNR
jgi:hypothetical protein